MENKQNLREINEEQLDGIKEKIKEINSNLYEKSVIEGEQEETQIGKQEYERMETSLSDSNIKKHIDELLGRVETKGIEKGKILNCEVCSYPMDTLEIQMIDEFDYDIAYVVCSECLTQTDILIETETLRKRIDKLKVVEQLRIYHEYLYQLEYEMEYTRLQQLRYNEFEDEIKDKIGDIEFKSNSEYMKEIKSYIKQYKMGIKNLLKLL